MKKVAIKDTVNHIKFYKWKYLELKKAKIHLVTKECKVQMHNECIDACKIKIFKASTKPEKEYQVKIKYRMYK